MLRQAQHDRNLALGHPEPVEGLLFTFSHYISKVLNKNGSSITFEK